MTLSRRGRALFLAAVFTAAVAAAADPSVSAAPFGEGDSPAGTPEAFAAGSVDRLVVGIRGRDETMETCVRGGLELRYRFDVRMCRRRRLWFDECGPVRSQTARIELEPFSEQYRVTRDVLDDGAPPAETVADTRDEAFALAAESAPFPASFVARDDVDLLRSGRRYVEFRTAAWCREEQSGLLDSVGARLFPGTVTIDRYESDWTVVTPGPRRGRD